ncbi:site-specific integrase [Lysinibacillus sphaericus]|uniref:site-specific integrase n=1 Tax=Lysinibacillus sphaericus TaxID=1421 RepID=UPI003F78CDDC
MHLNNEEINSLLNYVKKQEGFTHFILILLLVSTGIRKGEAAGLQWGDIDFSNNILTIQRTRDYLGTRSAKSQNSMRQIDVGSFLVSYLEKYKVWSKQKLLTDGRKLTNHDFVFINEHSLEPISKSFPNYILNRAYDSNVLLKRITPHTLRHTCASILITRYPNYYCRQNAW